jgi:flavodoxin
MKALVVYDSVFGNTGKIAQAIAKAMEAEMVRVSEVKSDQLQELALLIVGSPTRQFSPTSGTTSFLKALSRDALNGVKVAACDTRFTEEAIRKVRILAFFVSIFGYAAKPIAGRMQKKGGELVVPPEGFYVDDTEGPLLEGELERAADWARQIVATL